MTLRRRVQFQASARRTITIRTLVEDTGLVTPDLPLSTVTIYDPAGAIVAGPVAPTSPSSSTLAYQLTVPATVGENYRAVFSWVQSGQAAPDAHRETVWFDVVVEEWNTQLVATDLEQLVASIRFRLTKQAGMLSTAIAWDALAARRISEAADHFFGWIAKMVRETNRRSWVSLIPDNQRFDVVLACLAVAFTYRSDISDKEDDNDYRFLLWYARAEEEFSRMTLIEYDADQNAIPETEIRGPNREGPLFEELQRS